VQPWTGDIPAYTAMEVVERLGDAGVVVRDMPGLGWLRASCGFWTNHDDLERLIGAL